MAQLRAPYHDAVQRLAEVPGLGVVSAQQIIAEVGATAATFPSLKNLASWMGACPGTEESQPRPARDLASAKITPVYPRQPAHTSAMVRSIYQRHRLNSIAKISSD
jgi:Transposase IS116/IS110/IS902 family